MFKQEKRPRPPNPLGTDDGPVYRDLRGEIPRIGDVVVPKEEQEWFDQATVAEKRQKYRQLLKKKETESTVVVEMYEVFFRQCGCFDE